MRSPQPPKFLDTFYFSFEREDPNGSAFGDFGILPELQAIQTGLHGPRVDAESRLDGDVLPAVDRERNGDADDARVGWHLPDHLSVFRVERAEHSIIGATREHEPSCGRERGTPVGCLRECVSPDALAGVNVPRLHFTDVFRAGIDVERAR